MALQKLLIIAAFVAIIYNLGAALFHMMTDKGQSGKMAKSLTWRIGLSVGLILMIILAQYTGIIHLHGVTVGK